MQNLRVSIREIEKETEGDGRGRGRGSAHGGRRRGTTTMPSQTRVEETAVRGVASASSEKPHWAYALLRFRTTRNLGMGERFFEN